ncbi:MAG: hypothetical protein JWN46_259 [Acidimicrobiales bacterium]|nr:hypothetical protein [Acidimicrobiales bacterium]
MSDGGFLASPEPSPAAQAMFDEDISEVGYVMNASRLWAHQPATVDALFDVAAMAVADQGISFRQRAILVSACASALGDSYCALAWGSKLAGVAGDDLAGGVLRGDDERLTEAEQALARWARQVAHDPNATSETDVQALRDAGFTDSQIFAVTIFVAMRIAFSTVNDALGARPDAQLRSSAPAPVVEAVTYGRPIAGSSPEPTKDR